MRGPGWGRVYSRLATPFVDRCDLCRSDREQSDDRALLCAKHYSGLEEAFQPSWSPTQLTTSIRASFLGLQSTRRTSAHFSARCGMLPPRLSSCLPRIEGRSPAGRIGRLMFSNVRALNGIAIFRTAFRLDLG